MNKEIKIDPKIFILIAAVIAIILEVKNIPFNMSYYFLAISIFLILMINIPDKRCDDYAALKAVRKRGATAMLRLAKNFIDKECLIYTFNGTTVSGVIKEVSENALLIDNEGSLEAINLEFITRIREYPKNKKGKKKNIVID